MCRPDGLSSARPISNEWMRYRQLADPRHDPAGGRALQEANIGIWQLTWSLINQDDHRVPGTNQNRRPGLVKAAPTT